MRINSDNKTVDMEARDINYILPAYVRSYLFYNHNEMPKKIIFPMFPSVQVGDTVIPIEYIDPLGILATEIKEDGSSVAEVTEEQEAKIDREDAEAKRLKEELAQIGRGGEEVGGTPQPDNLALTPVPDEEVPEGLTEEEQNYEAAKADQPITDSPARAAFADTATKPVEDAIPKPAPERKPKQPEHPAPPGSQLDGMQSRDRTDQKTVARDLKEEPDIEEREGEEEVEIGKEAAEDKPDAPSGQ